MNQNCYAFSYKSGKSFFHKLPSWIKILFIPLFNIAIFSLSWKFAVFFVFAQALLFLCLHFSLKEQVFDLTPVLWYGIFLYLINILSDTYLNFAEYGIIKSFVQAVKNCIHDEKTFSVVVKFFACNQSASLMFKTWTSRKNWKNWTFYPAYSSMQKRIKICRNSFYVHKFYSRSF